MREMPQYLVPLAVSFCTTVVQIEGHSRGYAEEFAQLVIASTTVRLLGFFVVYFAVQISLNYRRGKRTLPRTWLQCGCVNSIRNCCDRMCRRGNYRNAHQLLNDDDGGGEVHFIPLSQGQQEALIECETARTTSPESPSVRPQPPEEEADDALLQF